MAKLTVKEGSTSRREYVFVQDSASTTGAGKTGIAHNASGIKAYYVRPGGSSQAITLASLVSPTAAFGSGSGWIEVDATNMPGIYRFDVPDAVFAVGAEKAVVMVFGASGMAPVVLEYDLVKYDPRDDTRLGLTQIPASGTIITGGTGTDQITTSTGRVTVGTIGNDVITAASIATDAGEEIANAVLSRNVSNVEGTMGEHTLGTVILAMLESAITGTGNPATLTIYRTNGTTTHVSKSVNTTAASTANVITSVY